MFENWVTRPQDRARLESNALGHELAVFAEWLESQSYPPPTVRRYLFAAAAFGRWVEQRGGGLEAVDESALQRFVASRRRQRCRGRRRCRLSVVVSGVGRFVQAMRARGLMSVRSPCQSHGPIDEIVAAFDSHLEQESPKVWSVIEPRGSRGGERGAGLAPELGGGKRGFGVVPRGLWGCQECDHALGRGSGRTAATSLACVDRIAGG
jgi:hypothetical protein